MDKASRDDTGETIGVYVKESKVLEEAELFRQATGNVGVVQVYAGDRQDERVIRGWGTVDTSVVAYMWPKPVGCKLVGIRGHSKFPGLESYVSLHELRGCDGKIGWIESLWSDLGEEEHDVDDAAES
ncbi:hypothetical protein OIU84_018874 [Salix udensis]|uniref:Uncharacterized protein n=1 Tax=Salix udensis TaxID=889485 RepID=A0AAD6KXI1_9ROSI|nr:hypothetical protein OIU84_018874 [Salix udensis]